MPYKYCPRCAGKLQRQHKILSVCAKCKFEMYLVPKVGANAILTNSRGEILLVKRNREPVRGAWATPGGHVEPGETSEQALARELREEIGARVKNLKYFGSYTGIYTYQNIAHPILQIQFVGKIAGVLRLGPEVSEAKFFKPAKIPFRSIAFRADLAALRDYLRRRS